MLLAIALATYQPETAPQVGLSECSIEQTVRGVQAQDGYFNIYVKKAQDSSDEFISCYGKYDPLTRTFSDVQVSAVRQGQSSNQIMSDTS